MKHTDIHINCSNCCYHANSAFCHLKTNELQKLNESKASNFVRKKHILFFENEPVKGLHCLHDGKVKLYKTLNDGSIQILKIAKASELIGYRGLLGNGRYIASAETIEDARICFIPKERIFELLSQNLNFTLGLMSKIANDISEVEKKAICFLQKSSKERLAEALLVLETTFGVKEGGYININLSREEIAAYTGMAVETTIRTLHVWENEGIISLFKKQILIADKDRLLQISNIED